MNNQKIYNTLAREKQTFVPITAGKVQMYVCGMTVYDFCHIGHARVMVVFDMVQRWFRASGYDVTYVQNITDIDDKIINRAVQNGESISTLTSRYITYMQEDAAALGVQTPDFVPRATSYIPQMVTLIEQLQKNGLAYQASDGDVNFSVRDFKGYGKLSGKSLDDLRAGERVDVNTGKRDPLDFVLWKSAKASEPAEVKWESPWGAGRPGWHIECSAMASDLLGGHFDIHGGGQDLQFPHHENEIAQSEGAHQHQFVTYWMHNGCVRIDDEKMSKSLGNFFTIREVLKQYDPEVIRFFILRTHYRSQINYSTDNLEDAKSSLTRLYSALKEVAPDMQPLDLEDNYAKQFYAAMYDDFNTAQALAVLFELAADVFKTKSAVSARQLALLAKILGFLERTPQEFLQSGAENGVAESEIAAKIAARTAAKSAKNFALSDQIRAELLAQGIVLEDKPGGITEWRRA